MKNLTFIKLFATSLLLVLSTSCEKSFLDPVRDDPNNPLSVTEALQLSGLLGNFSYQVIANDPARITSYWIQHTAFTAVPPSADNYDLDESDVNNLWSFASYTAVMNNARILSEKATASGNHHYAGIGKVILAWNMSIVTDLWGDVPYSEAWVPERTTKPKYDSQESIYMAIQALLDGAIADFNNTSNLSPSTDDLLYSAASQAAWRTNSLPKWQRLTYTLKARFHMRLTNAPGYDPVTQSNLALAALANGFKSNADNARFKYYSEAGAENPWYQWTIDDKWNDDTRLSESYVNRLKGLNDPRLAVQARPTVTGSTADVPNFAGAPNGEGNLVNNTISQLGTYYSSADAPVTWLSYTEAKFLEAEATFRTRGAAAAQPIYRDAVAASLSELGVAAGAQTTYLNSRPALTAGNALEEIMEQKYIALFLQFEAYHDWRRTGFPNDLTLAKGALVPSIPLRVPYPQDELLNNAANVAATGVPVGRPALAVPVWWDK